MKLTKLLPIAAAAALLPTFALAQDAPAPVSDDLIWMMNTLLFLIGGFLVFFMAAGFAMLEGGLVRSKNATTQMTKNVALFSIASIAYWAIGYNLMYPLGDWMIGHRMQWWLMENDLELTWQPRDPVLARVRADSQIRTD